MKKLAVCLIVLMSTGAVAHAEDSPSCEDSARYYVKTKAGRLGRSQEITLTKTTPDELGHYYEYSAADGEYRDFCDVSPGEPDECSCQPVQVLK